MRRPSWWMLVLVVSLAWLLVGTDCKGRPLRETQIVSFEVNPNPVIRGGNVVVGWQAEHVGWRDEGPYCTLQHTFEGQPAEAIEVVDCVGTRTDAVDATESATYVNYRFSALRRTGQAYETADVRLEILHVGVSLAPASVALEPLSSQDFTATVTGTTDTRVDWDASCGSISGSGSTVTYTAPASVPDPPTCVLTATSAVDSEASATASVTVVPEREAQIVSFEINPNPVVRGGSVVVAWQAENAGLMDGGPYCTLQRRFEGQPVEGLEVVPCQDSRTDVIDAAASYVNYRFSALRRSGQTYETEDIRLEIVHAGVVVAPASVTLEPLSSQDFTATVTGVADASVTWDASCGSIGGSGSTVTYTAPAGVPDPPTCQVTATSQADPNASASAVVTVAYAAGAVIWTRQFGSEWSDEEVGGVAIDRDDNVILAFNTTGGAWGSGGMVMYKLDPNGMTLWYRSFGTPADERVRGVTVDANGDIIVTGFTRGDLGGPNAGSADVFLAKFDANGHPQWTHQFGSAEWDEGTAVTTDSQNNIIVGGFTEGDLAGPKQYNQYGFVAEFDQDANPQWMRQFCFFAEEAVLDVAVGPNDEVAAAGFGYRSATVRHFDASGNETWRAGPGYRGSARGVAFDASGFLLAAGSGLPDSGSFNAGVAFLAKLDADGTVTWTRDLGPAEGSTAWSFATDGAGNALIAGATHGYLGGPDPMAPGFLAKYDASGNRIWVRHFQPDARSVAVDSRGNSIVAGNDDGNVHLMKFAP